jgi:hypothetical protein
VHGIEAAFDLHGRLRAADLELAGAGDAVRNVEVAADALETEAVNGDVAEVEQQPARPSWPDSSPSPPRMVRPVPSRSVKLPLSINASRKSSVMRRAPTAGPR